MSLNCVTVFLVAVMAGTAFQSAQARVLLQEGGGGGGGGGGQVGGLVPDLGCVRVNEVVHKPAKIGDVKGRDFVELYNNCAEAVNLAGWSLADEKENTFTMGQESCEHIIEANSRLVFFRKKDCSFQFGFGGNDKVTLRDATTSIVDQVAWGKDNANKGRSWARIPDATGGFQDGKPTPGGENAPFE